MENLTKENFFNELMEKYPAAMANFCKWIDEYKKRVDWHGLFNWNYHAGEKEPDGKDKYRYPKFHEIPYEMQIGIILKWMQEATEQDESMLDVRNDFIEMMELYNSHLNEKNDSIS